MSVSQRLLVRSVVVAGLTIVSGLAQTSGRTAGNVHYSEQTSNGSFFTSLRATVKGKTWALIDKSKGMCLNVIDQRDFDGNGLVDALVKHDQGCGGNCCSDTFFFVSAFAGGRFRISDEFGDSSSAFPVIEKWKGRWSVVVTSDNEGVNQERPIETTERFILQSGKAVRVEARTRKELDSIAELRSEIFNPDNVDETHSIEYDLDGDGRTDRISGKLWFRWGRIMWSVDFANGRKFSSNVACRRIGVLQTKTDAVSDLVCDQDTIFRWNGREYRTKAKE